MSKRVLLTGGSGFIGHHCIDHFLVNTDWEIVVLDSLTYAGDTGKIYDSKIVQNNLKRVKVFWHDLNAPIMDSLKRRIGKINYIINMASESHVDNSIANPVPFVINNVRLMLNMMEYARETNPETFIQFSTDEVFGPTDNEKSRGFAEWSLMIPSNPYSGSKAAQEVLGISYWRTYKLPLIIVNVMNNFGERQNREKFIPKVIHSVINNEKVIIHGNETESGSRNYLHARNTADAILFLLKLKSPSFFPQCEKPDKYNIVGDKQVNNLDMARFIAKELDKPLNYELVDFHKTRPGHDPHYGLDGSKLKELGWEAPFGFEESLRKVIKWTVNNPDW